MKELFDINTSKYLELSKDWLYGGYPILIITTLINNINRVPNTDIHTNYKLEISNYVKWDTLPHLNEEELRTNCNVYGLMHLGRTTSHPLHTRWCGMFQDCIYGDRYVLLDDVKMADKMLLESYSKDLKI